MRTGLFLALYIESCACLGHVEERNTSKPQEGFVSASLLQWWVGWSIITPLGIYRPAVY